MALLPKRPQHILELSKEQKRTFLNSFDFVFSDIDGVIWNMEHNVPGAATAYEQLKDVGKQLAFVTNNSVRTMKACVHRFKSLGMQVSPQDIWHPAQTIVKFLKAIKFDGLIYIIATDTFKSILREEGFKLIDGPTKIIDETYKDLAHHIFDSQPVRAVIIDVDFNLSSLKLLRAQTYLRHPECMLISGATDMLLPVGKNVEIIGPGPFGKILIEASKKSAITLGKPGKHLGELLLSHYAIANAQRTLMIGDMLEQDVGFGKVCGFQTLLVLSGGCKLQELEQTTAPERIPDYYADSVSDLATLMREVRNSSY